MDAFHRRFLTHATISTRFGEHRNTILARLKVAGVAPFRPGRQDYGAIYLRQDVEALYARNGR
ncbi:hypothetical protein FHG71_15220 [Rubellimicrobium roseum]|uniref:DNA-binding protein n=2 Tax=Rubellimicrobium roseum TaxID=687525 RepID=A0A5C4NBR7_9RHOB|nr:hypothetical protein FHG71_15220 [Rubellimicrobium roseum]